MTTEELIAQLHKTAKMFEGETPWLLMKQAADRLSECAVPRVLTLEEVAERAQLPPDAYSEEAPVYAEFYSPKPIYLKWLTAETLNGWLKDDRIKDYGKANRCGWRCWTSRPTDEQRKAVNWDA